jgi:hypothetical protein
MSAEEFWLIIDTAIRSSNHCTEVPGWLVRHLAGQRVEVIEGFAVQYGVVHSQAFDERLWFAAQLIMGMCSEDVFVDFRAWLVANGRVSYEAVLDNPDYLADLVLSDGDNGLPKLFYMGSVAFNAFQQKFNGDPEAELRLPSQPAQLRNDGFWDGHDSTLAAIYPKLWARYGRHRSA